MATGIARLDSSDNSMQGKIKFVPLSKKTKCQAHEIVNYFSETICHCLATQENPTILPRQLADHLWEKKVISAKVKEFVDTHCGSVQLPNATNTKLVVEAMLSRVMSELEIHPEKLDLVFEALKTLDVADLQDLNDEMMDQVDRAPGATTGLMILIPQILPCQSSTRPAITTGQSSALIITLT